MELSDEQRDVLMALVSGFRRGNLVQTVGGYAGTGKTTLIKSLISHMSHVKVCAFTGAAANVLREKGVSEASTIHSLIYEVNEEYGHVSFELRKRLEDTDAIVVDEASMVNKYLYNDLLSFRLPVIFVGDHGQLEPVNGMDFNLMQDPEYKLETIHRNAGEIARFCEHLRNGELAVKYKATGPEVQLHQKQDIKGSLLLTTVDQMICGKNKTRVAANKRLRQLMGHRDDMPVPGDRIMCLRNDRGLGLYNGLQGRLAAITNKGDHYEIYFQSNGTKYKKIPVSLYQFNAIDRSANFRKRDREIMIPFDYAYCATCHKAQGSEFNSVMVLEERANWDQAKWSYTAASRAKTKLHWVIGY